MSKFDGLIGVLDKLKDDEYGTWKVDHEHKGTPDDPIHFPFPIYTEAVHEFIEAVYDFHEKNPDFELTRYSDIMHDRGIENLESADINSLDVQGVMALLMWTVRGERFCDGLILSEMKEGRIQALLERLKTITE